jgi:hypothetical protein
LIVGPRFEVEGVECIFEVDVFCGDVFDGFEDVIELTDGADGYAEAAVELGVTQRDVSAVSFEGYAVVAVVDGPVAEVDV